LFSDLKLTSLEFEKDDDANGHIDFITIASNIRASNYKIPHADKHKTKGIAGKIIPAIATTTSIVAGLVILEMFKLLHNHSKIEQYRSTTLNLALPFMAPMDPIEVPKYKTCSKEYSIWDTLVVHGDRTVAELIDTLEKQLGLDVDMILYGSKIVDSTYNAPAHREKRQNMLVSEAIEELTGEKIKTSMVKLIISVEDDNDEEAQAPDVRFYFQDQDIDENNYKMNTQNVPEENRLNETAEERVNETAEESVNPIEMVV
jgi:ubiquitin-activating enzyme E1